MAEDVTITQVCINAYQQTFGEILEGLARGVVSLGMSVRLRRIGVFEPMDLLVPDTVNVLMGHLLFTTGHLRDADGRLPFVVRQLEPLSREAGLTAQNPAYLDLLRRATRVWDYNANNIAFLRGIGIEHCDLLPFGFNGTLLTVPQGLDKTIDACFFGCLTPRRLRILEAIAAAGVNVVAREKCYGQERDELIARSRICLNLHAYDGLDILEEARLSMLLANRCFVVSDLSDHNPYGGGITFAHPQDMAEACRFWLNQPAERRAAIAEKGYQALLRRPFLPCLREALVQYHAAVNPAQG